MPIERQARCSCGEIRPSEQVKDSWFVFRGEGSKVAKEHCACGYYEAAHTINLRDICLKFRPHGAYEFDSFYCGHSEGQGN